jgi:RNA polymerase sigma-70 factor (ECF subfamily)
MIEYNGLSDEKLVSLVQGGNYDAFEELVKRYEGKIYGHSLRLLGNQQDAEDVLQETFLNAFRGLGDFRGDSTFSTWIYRIATNNALMKLRKAKRKFGEFNEDLPPPEVLKKIPSGDFDMSPGDVLLEKELLDKLSSAVDRLPEKYRTIFLLRDVEEFSTQKTAEILGISTSAVKSRLHRARIFLREALSYIFDEGTSKRDG